MPAFAMCYDLLATLLVDPAAFAIGAPVAMLALVVAAVLVGFGVSVSLATLLFDPAAFAICYDLLATLL